MGAALKAEDVFNIADFQSMETAFTMIKNLTTRTELDKLDTARIVEIGDKSIVFEVEKNCGAKGHSIIIGLKVTLPSKGDDGTGVQFDATTTVQSLERQDDDYYRYEVDLVQYEEKSWQQFLEIFGSRQKEINEFIAAVKG